MKKSFCLLLVTMFLFCIFFSTYVSAEETTNENKFYLGEHVNAGKDTGYSDSKTISEDDPHFGWEIGVFFVSGYSAIEKNENGESVFLKNVGDKVALWFCLNQNINELNGNKSLFICDDTDGYDKYFGIKKTNFKKGTLIIRHKNHQNQWEKPQIYTDYLNAKTSKGAYTQVELFEEGDYEVALNYEIKQINLNILGWKPFPDYYNYRIFFRFSVRNGNCMVYPFDIKTGTELTNSAYTENGFRLDFANSQYLKVNIKKEMLNQGAEGLVEDIRYNRPAKNGELFTEEGIYTITVNNEYTKQETVKKLYVGNNDVLKAHVYTGFPVEEIKQQISLGATVGENGELIPKAPNSNTAIDSQTNNCIIYIIIGLVALLFIVIIFLIAHKKKSKKEPQNDR